MKKTGKNQSKPSTLLSLFSGCGGMDLGFEGGFRVKKPSVRNKAWISKCDGDDVVLKSTGIKTVFACDIKKSASINWTHNFGRSGFHLESIVDLVKAAKAGEMAFPKVDIVTGGFPCQDFSVAGKRKGFNSDRSHDMSKVDAPSTENRGMLYYWMMQVIDLVRPNIFIAENVKGLVSLGDVKQVIADDFRKVGGGYLVLEPQVLHAGDFGVPQSRERVFFIGLRMDALRADALEALLSGSFDFDPYPPSTHSVRESDIVPCKDYLSDLPEPEASGDLSQQAYSKAKWYGRHCQGQTEVKFESLAPTIRSEHHGNIEFRRLGKESGGLISNEYHLPQRRLSVRECARIQTFPDNFDFVQTGVSASDAYRLIGNAVPPFLAYHLAMRIKSLWGKLFLD